jgi:flagellar biosynthesis/type III secretory pathway protein FliH
VIEQLRVIAGSLEHLRRQRLADAEAELAQVAAEIASRILHGELVQPGDSSLRMARACIAEAAGDGPLVLRVAPSDLELLRAHLPELELDLSEHELRIEPAPEIATGGVVLETRSRCYDGRPQRILADAVRRLEPAKTAT